MGPDKSILGLPLQLPNLGVTYSKVSQSRNRNMCCKNYQGQTICHESIVFVGKPASQDGVSVIWVNKVTNFHLTSNLNHAKSQP